MRADDWLYSGDPAAPAIGDVRVTATPGAEPSVELRTDALAMNRMSTPTMEFDGTTLAIEVAGRSGPCFAACLGTVTILVELGDLALDELDVASDVGTVAVNLSPARCRALRDAFAAVDVTA